jgi:hypothetical protein
MMEAVGIKAMASMHPAPSERRRRLACLVAWILLLLPCSTHQMRCDWRIELHQDVDLDLQNAATARPKCPTSEYCVNVIPRGKNLEARPLRYCEGSRWPSGPSHELQEGK